MAQRTYEYSDERRKLVVVNDATIIDEGMDMPLIADIDSTLAGGGTGTGVRTDIVACINRGILIEELALIDAETETAGALLVSWLARGELRLGAYTLESSVDLHYARSAELQNYGAPFAHIVVIFVDECSLFEMSPRMSIVDNSVREDSAYRIRRLSERRMDASVVTEMPASDLLDAVLETLERRVVERPIKEGTPAADPLAGNLESLESAGVRSALLTLARSAELATSTRMTYRELWGYLARILIGGAPEQIERHQLESFIWRNQPRGANPLEDFRRIGRLSSLRFTQAIFGAGALPLSGSRAVNDPVLRLTRKIDPILDAVPGNSPFVPRNGWADPLHEAFVTQSTALTPLAALHSLAEKTEVPKGGAFFSEICSPFDWAVDAAYAALMADESVTDAERLKSTSWYGAYLTRLYAVCFGISAFRREIDALTETMITTPRLPDVLRKPMETLLRPKRQLRYGESEALLPLFDSRTEPIVGHLIEPKLALRVENGKLETVRGGSDEVFLELKREGELEGRIIVDFALVREALACVDDYSGVTDLVDVTAPRLERVRSSRLRSRLVKGAELRLASGVDSHLVTFRQL
ncbi:hypothetical protein ACW4FP_04695 [Paenarthrobacter ureafaciens]